MHILNRPVVLLVKGFLESTSIFPAKSADLTSCFLTENCSNLRGNRPNLCFLQQVHRIFYINSWNTIVQQVYDGKTYVHDFTLYLFRLFRFGWVELFNTKTLSKYLISSVCPLKNFGVNEIGYLHVQPVCCKELG